MYMNEREEGGRVDMIRQFHPPLNNHMVIMHVCYCHHYCGFSFFKKGDHNNMGMMSK